MKSSFSENLQEKIVPRIILTGPRGAGKSTIGRSLALLLNYSFLDLDQEIEERAQNNIGGIIENGGWKTFRKLEEELLKEILKNFPDGVVLALGGGTAVHQDDDDICKESFALLTQLKDSLIINLTTDFITLQKRIEKNQKNVRPPLIQSALESYQRRLELYPLLADFTFWTTEDSERDSSLLKKIISREIKLTVLIGDPITHSKSPRLHNGIYRELSINDRFYYSYKRIREDNSSFYSFYLDKIKKWTDLRALTVTIPHKENILKVFNQNQSENKNQEKLSAVNTIIFTPNDQKKNSDYELFNTDIIGLKKIIISIKKRFNQDREEEKSILVIGSGGVALASLQAISHTEFKILIVARNRQRGEDLANQFKGDYYPLSEINRSDSPLISNEKISLIINATPLGMVGKLENESPFNSLFLGELKKKNPLSLFMDLVYTPKETLAIKLARSYGLDVMTGDLLFELQAQQQFELIINQKVGEDYFREKSRKIL